MSIECELTKGQVTLILPCLNARDFLEDRINSILTQTYKNWKAIVLDSYSSDGSWEYFQLVAKSDPRFAIYQIPKNGLYAALNHGIELAKGEYFHIATCDDTMHPEYLQETVQALECYKNASIAVTDIIFIDKNGKKNLSYKNGEGHVRISEIYRRESDYNLRYPPHDSLMHMSLETVYVSLTQLLIRRKDIQSSDRFDTNVGSCADYGWALNLCKNLTTIHIPKQLATWRHHGNQLSLKPDPTISQTASEACIEFMNEFDLISPKFKRLFLLPAKRVNIYTKPHEVIFIYTYCILFLIEAILKKPIQSIRFLKYSKFGKEPLRRSWVSFLMLYLNIKHVRCN